MADSSGTPVPAGESWPALPLEAWSETYATLHMWTQVVGKVRLARAPMVNHWWQVPLYVTVRGLTTSPIPDGGRTFQIDLDFLDHQLHLQTSDGQERRIALRSRPVAAFYREVMDALGALGVEVEIWTGPVEIEDPIPFDEDREHATYDPEHAQRFWRVLVAADRVMTEFRSRFVGKCSPVHFFWGSFDLAVTRFSGRRAPPHPGGIPNLADWVTREAYSRECSSCGFWPGSGPVKAPAFYAYAYPAPEGFAKHPVRPPQAFYSEEMQEFILLYEDVRQADDPERMLLDFFQSTYDATAELGRWDREELEEDYPAPGSHPGAGRAAAFPEHEADDPASGTA
ncbi:MAG TPA: DUF5996 family protein [Longimicrobiaceae bacterium]|nr:DUF5996 family protein [Longimicrobiaceae bacterium]